MPEVTMPGESMYMEISSSGLRLQKQETCAVISEAT